MKCHKPCATSNLKRHKLCVIFMQLSCQPISLKEQKNNVTAMFLFQINIYLSFRYLSGLLSEEQCKARDARRKAKQRYTQNVHEGSSEKKPALNPECSNSNSGEGIETKAQSPPEVKFASTLSPYAIIDSRPIQSVCEDTRKLIEKLVKLQDKFEFPEESKVNDAIVSINMHLGFCNSN